MQLLGCKTFYCGCCAEMKCFCVNIQNLLIYQIDKLRDSYCNSSLFFLPQHIVHKLVYLKHYGNLMLYITYF